ncbi:type IV pilin protein [Crenothrix polyspora]|uniref:Tfp pilus assembly protein PilE n=1 Tax=Crenothrix polyspora TaxID=360316 RepID=A0A1R4HAY9_9GAMM|nr:type IV pilin protein [Crenothrix polyspora]SJM93336.1 Tfp pilus assembly protein PilE [Crenothrix polyspora]
MKIKLYGFTLIELTIAVAIVGILASIVYPSYMGQIRKSKRADAKAALTSFANAMEIYKMQNGNSYLGAGAPDNGSPKATVFPQCVPTSSSCTLTPHIQTYNLSISSATDSSYTLNATPDSTSPDSICGTFSLTNTGVKTKSGSGTDCW